jgi:predicted transcriptional regulator of viral defense system
MRTYWRLVMHNNLRRRALTEEIDYNFVVDALSDYRNPRVKIHDLLKKGDIIRIKKGLYVFGPDLARGPYSKETLANLIYGPSYISLEYALSFYGLIPEKVETVTSVTNKRKKLFRTPVGVFSYAYINPALFPHGVTLHEIDKLHMILIATREKALCDTLYFSEKIESASSMLRHLVENLRIEREDLKSLNADKIKRLARIYGHNADLLHESIRSV